MPNVLSLTHDLFKFPHLQIIQISKCLIGIHISGQNNILIMSMMHISQLSNKGLHFEM